MPWRLILAIVIFAVFLAFITVNLDNRCDINFGFHQFKEVPIFLTVFISFFMGLVCGAPLVLHLRKKKKIGMPRKEKKQIDDNFSSSSANSETDEKIKQDAASARERFLANRRGGK
jgi:uncharacterized integral membrane protein